MSPKSTKSTTKCLKFTKEWMITTASWRPRRSRPDCARCKSGRPSLPEEEEEEEEEDLFVFNDTIEGPRAPAVKPGRVTQA